MFELIRANKRRSVALIASFCVVLGMVGAAFGFYIGNGLVGTIVALVAVVASAVVGPRWLATGFTGEDGSRPAGRAADAGRDELHPEHPHRRRHAVRVRDQTHL